MVWVKFIICAAIVVFAGTKLSKYGDAITEKTRLTGAWVGLLLLATITSMPELVAGISSVAVVKLPDLAVGMVLGSNLFNLAIIAILDIQHRKSPLLSSASRQHILSASLCIVIIGLSGMAIFLGKQPHDWSVGRIGIFSILLLIIYFISLRFIAHYEANFQSESEHHKDKDKVYEYLSTRRTYFNFALSAVVIIGASIWLATIGDEIAVETGWKASFVGSLFLAVISSLPELTVCIAALRLGAIDMAIADILGSNMFNTGVIITASDAFLGSGSVLSASSNELGWAAIIALGMTCIVILGILFPSRRKKLRIASWESPLLLALWIFGAYVLFTS